VLKKAGGGLESNSLLKELFWVWVVKKERSPSKGKAIAIWGTNTGNVNWISAF